MIDSTTFRTHFAARKESVDLFNMAAIPSAFVFTLAYKFAPSRIVDRFGEAPVANHPLNVKVLQREDTVFGAYWVRFNFVTQEVTSNVL